MKIWLALLLLPLAGCIGDELVQEDGYVFPSIGAGTRAIYSAQVGGEEMAYEEYFVSTHHEVMGQEIYVGLVTIDEFQTFFLASEARADALGAKIRFGIECNNDCEHHVSLSNVVIAQNHTIPLIPGDQWFNDEIVSAQWSVIGEETLDTSIGARDTIHVRIHIEGLVTKDTWWDKETGIFLKQINDPLEGPSETITIRSLDIRDEPSNPKADVERLMEEVGLSLPPGKSASFSGPPTIPSPNMPTPPAQPEPHESEPSEPAPLMLRVYADDVDLDLWQETRIQVDSKLVPRVTIESEYGIDIVEDKVFDYEPRGPGVYYVNATVTRGEEVATASAVFVATKTTQVTLTCFVGIEPCETESFHVPIGTTEVSFEMDDPTMFDEQLTFAQGEWAETFSSDDGFEGTVSFVGPGAWDVTLHPQIATPFEAELTLTMEIEA